MAVLTANRERRQRNLTAKRKLALVGVDSDEFYEGGLVNYSAGASTCVPASDTASERFAGVCIERVTTGVGNTTLIELEWGHEEWFELLDLAAGDEGLNCVVSDDSVVTDTAAATNDVLVGTIVELETINGTAGAWVALRIEANANA
jgi:hypothetical protein